MKYLIIVCLLLCCTVCHSQDTIIQRNGSRIPAKVLEIDKQDVKYKKFENLDGPSYVISKSDVSIIRYQNGSSDTLNNYVPMRIVKIEAKPLSEMYKKGEEDAEKYYVKYKTPARWTLGTTLALNAIGLIPAVAISSTPPQRENLGYPDANLLNNNDYITGYVAKAKEKKQRRVMKSFIWGAVGSFVIYGSLVAFLK